MVSPRAGAERANVVAYDGGSIAWVAPGGSAARCLRSLGPLAHRVEQGTFNPKVPGSRPGRPTVGHPPLVVQVSGYKTTHRATCDPTLHPTFVGA